jgi:hypothetical protein
LRGVQPFNGQPSKGFELNQSSTWIDQGLYALDLESALRYNGSGKYGKDVVALNGGNGSANGVSLANQLVAGIAAKDYLLGIFGLGIRPTSFSSSSPAVPSFMQTLKSLNLIPSMSYGYTAGAVYRNKKVFANLVLGGYDQSRFKPATNPHSFSFASADADSLTVGVQSIVADNTLIGTTSFTVGGGHLSVIDSTVPHLWLPRAICDQMEKAFGLTYDPLSDLYLVNDTIHAQLLSSSPSFTFKIGDTAYDNGNGTNIQLPYAAFDLKVGWPVYSTDQNYFPIRRATSDTQYRLGRTLLQETYLVVDYERRNFTIGQAVFPDPLPASRIVTISANGTSTENGSSGISTGAIAGIAVAGGIIAILLIAGLIWFIRRPKQDPNKVGELDGQSRPQPGQTYTDRKEGHNAESAPAEMYAEGEHQISELGAPMVDRKDRPHNFAHELPSPAAPVVYYEMDGSHTTGKRGSHPPSPLINRNLTPSNDSQPPSAVSPSSSTFQSHLAPYRQSQR